MFVLGSNAEEETQIFAAPQEDEMRAKYITMRISLLTQQSSTHTHTHTHRGRERENKATLCFQTHF